MAQGGLARLDTRIIRRAVSGLPSLPKSAPEAVRRFSEDMLPALPAGLVELIHEPGVGLEEAEVHVLMSVVPEEAGVALTVARMDVISRRWARWRQTYRFDPDLTEELLRTDVSDVPLDVLRGLPFNAIFVQQPIDDEGALTGVLTQKGSRIEGYFAAIDKDGVDVSFVVRGDDNMPSCASTPVPFSTTLSELLAQSPGGVVHPPEGTDRAVMGIATAEGPMRIVLTQLLYLASRDPDVTRATPPYRHPEKMKRKGIPMPVTWDVGPRIGPVLRAAKEGRQTDDDAKAPGGRGEQGHSPAPHVRRGHWHHFWTGPMDGERELVLKWLHPCFVGFDKEDGHAPNERETIRRVAK